MDEKAIVCVIVQRGTARPYYLQGKGIRPEGVYVRQGASTVPATDTAILNMIKDTSGESYWRLVLLNSILLLIRLSISLANESRVGRTQMRSLI